MRANTKVEKCVITVPAYFNDSQKQSTIKAARIAGLDCKAIINEPTAAALCFTKDISNENSSTRKVLIFDFGGGTFDVSILDITGKNSVVKATTGDTHLGGQDIDNALVQLMLQRIKENRPDFEVTKKKIQKLRLACKEAKILLTGVNNTEVVAECLFPEDQKD